jgi:hypothetical protein
MTTATCPCCLTTVKLLKNGTIPRHGFTQRLGRKSDSSMSCPGQRMTPDMDGVGRLNARIATLDAYAAKLDTLTDSPDWWVAAAHRDTSAERAHVVALLGLHRTVGV